MTAVGRSPILTDCALPPAATTATTTSSPWLTATWLLSAVWVPQEVDFGCVYYFNLLYKDIVGSLRTIMAKYVLYVGVSEEAVMVIVIFWLSGGALCITQIE